MSDSYMARPDRRQQAPKGADLLKPELDDPDTISISISWRRSRPSCSWIDVNRKPLGQYHPLQDWPRPELDRAGRVLRSVAAMYDVDVDGALAGSAP